LQEVIRSILEAYYEPQCSSHSHGFRSGRGCHTALRTITQPWRGVKWFIEGDIHQCFDRLAPTVLLSILGEKLHDNRFLRLRAHLFKAGYLADWTYHPTLSGVPQGGGGSPSLMNSYLDRLDQFVETVRRPLYNRGDRRKRYQPDRALLNAARRKTAAGQCDEARRLRQQAQGRPSRDPVAPHFRR
jgi:retron-type reverse transcriptase